MVEARASIRLAMTSALMRRETAGVVNIVKETVMKVLG